ncbi:MAG: FliA/WhiG family RNA polymerase sigma factor [Longimicrobiales bacterium]
MTETMLWEAARSTEDTTARDELLLKHMGLVHHVARQVMRSTRVDAAFEELVSAGTIGLMNAIENFDPSRGLAFSTFAAPRIRGSVLDDLRRRDHAPRSIRKKQRDMARVQAQLSADYDRPPTDEEMADALEIPVEKLWTWQRQSEQAARVSLDRPLDSATEGGNTARDILAGDDGREIEMHINQAEEVQLLRDEILSLKEQERIVLSLYYFEELKLHEIATVLGVTESRISQIRTKAIANLRGRLAHLRD